MKWMFLRELRRTGRHAMCPGRDAACNAASQNRDRYGYRVWNGPGSAAHHCV